MLIFVVLYELKLKFFISFFIIAYCTKPLILFAQNKDTLIQSDFYGDPLEFKMDKSFAVDFEDTLSPGSVDLFFQTINATNYYSVLNALKTYKEKYKPDDWLFYQLIRKTAQQISPKAENYNRYTLYKWFLLTKSGYDAILTFSGNKLLFYVRSEENIYNIPLHVVEGNQYICLNYHDFENIDFKKDKFLQIKIKVPGAEHSFSYKVTQLPDFNTSKYSEKDLTFNYYQSEYHFKVKLNPQIQTIFANYPVVDYKYFFNIPLSKQTYLSLIPQMKKDISRMNKKNGIDFLMHFTRYAFLFENDTEAFGGEKRLSPEETLLYEHSDCEDRAALFFYLVKEIYNLPMIVLVYPKHVTIAVQLDKPIGNPIIYNGKKYSVCEPTPQQKDLRLGQGIPELSKTSYEIVYAYNPWQSK